MAFAHHQSLSACASFYIHPATVRRSVRSAGTLGNGEYASERSTSGTVTAGGRVPSQTASLLAAGSALGMVERWAVPSRCRYGRRDRAYVRRMDQANHWHVDSLRGCLLCGGRPTDHRVVRGGAFNNNQRNARCAYRNRNNPNNHWNNNGFRVVLVASTIFQRPELSGGENLPSGPRREKRRGRFLAASWPRGQAGHITTAPRPGLCPWRGATGGR